MIRYARRGFTTKFTKDTKVRLIKVSNFVIFVSFVVKPNFLSHFPKIRPRKLRLRLGRCRWQHDHGLLALILDAGGKIAFDLSLGVELDRRADHHAVLDFGLAKLVERQTAPLSACFLKNESIVSPAGTGYSGKR